MTTTKKPLGTWRNPPLAYVVAEIRISPYLNIERRVPEFQDAIRKDFPIMKEARLIRFGLGGGSEHLQMQKMAWRFISETKGLGIDLSERAVALHATEYVDFETFQTRLKGVITSVSNTIPDLYVEQLGLRYIDYILPNPTETPFDYLAQSLHGAQPAGAQSPIEAYWIAHYPYENGGLNVRVIPRMPRGSYMPPDFAPIELEPASTMLEADSRAKSGKEIGCIDTDRFVRIDHHLDVNEILDTFNSMHSDVSTAFRALISDKARTEWM